jgi:hypothetical protein
LGLKFLHALQNALANHAAELHHGCRRASLELWRAECLTDREANPKSASSVFNKYKRELIAANRIACDERFAWLIG